MLCPKGCKTDLPDTEMRAHLISAHRTTPTEADRLIRNHGGYYEGKRPDTQGDFVALEHQKAAKEAALRNRTSDLMDIPISTGSEPKKELHLPEGWVSVGDKTYSYKCKISEKHSASSVEERVIKAEVTENHSKADMLISTKDMGELYEIENKARILLNRLAGYVPSDPEHSIISEQYCKANEEAKSLRHTLIPEITSELVHEDYYHGEIESSEHIQWQEEQMKKIINEADRLRKVYS